MSYLTIRFYHSCRVFLIEMFTMKINGFHVCIRKTMLARSCWLSSWLNHVKPHKTPFFCWGHSLHECQHHRTQDLKEQSFFWEKMWRFMTDDICGSNLT